MTATPKPQTRTRQWIELAVLTVLIVSLAISLFVLRRQDARHADQSASR